MYVQYLIDTGQFKQQAIVRTINLTTFRPFVADPESVVICSEGRAAAQAGARSVVIASP